MAMAAQHGASDPDRLPASLPQLLDQHWNPVSGPRVFIKHCAATAASPVQLTNSH